MFNLQANSFDISKGIQEDLDMQMMNSGISITGFNVMSFSYPKEIQDMINKNASHGMVSDIGRYQQIELTDGMASGKMTGGGAASDMAGMMMGMNIANQMMKQMNQSTPNQGAADQSASGQPSSNQPAPNQSQPNQPAPSQSRPNFCPNCGTKTTGGNFCSNCGQKLV